jgi:hypothetical protein
MSAVWCGVRAQLTKDPSKLADAVSGTGGGVIADALTEKERCVWWRACSCAGGMPTTLRLFCDLLRLHA